MEQAPTKEIKQSSTEEKKASLQEALADMDKAGGEINAKAEEDKKKAPVKTEEKTTAKVKKVEPSKTKIKVARRIEVEDGSREEADNNELDEERVVLKLRKFLDDTKSKIVLNPGTPDEKVHALAPAWTYLAELKQSHIVIEKTYCTTHPFDSRIMVVHCIASLVCDECGEIINQVEAIADTSEEFLKNKPLNSAYGLAQTRAKSRAVQTVYGHYMSQAKIESTPAEEIAAKEVDLEAV